MSITYSYRITNVLCYPTYQSLENLVFTVLWEYKGTDGTYSSIVLGSTDIPYNPATEYKPFATLTETDVISWVEQYTDPAVITDAQALINTSIDNSANPPTVINPTLPWAVG